MQKILARLNRVRSIRGSLLATRYGEVVASGFVDETTAETIGAVASEVLLAVENAAARLKLGRFRLFSISGRDGCCVAVPVASALLLVLVESDANLAMIRIEVRDAAEELGRKLHIS